MSESRIALRGRMFARANRGPRPRTTPTPSATTSADSREVRRARASRRLSSLAGMPSLGVPSRRSGGVPGPTHRQRFSGQLVGARQVTTVGDDVGPLAEECLELYAPAVLASHADRLLEQLDGSRAIAFSAPGAGARERRAEKGRLLAGLVGQCKRVRPA